MIKQSLKFLEPYRFFLQKNFALALFICLLVFKEWYKTQDVNLTDFSNYIASIATNNLIDIGKRVTLFYQSILMLITLFCSLVFVLKFLSEKLINKAYWQGLNYFSGIGLFLLLFNLITSNNYASVQFLFALIVAFTIYHLLLAKSFLSETYRSYNFLLWLFSLSFSISFLFRELLLVNLSADKVLGFHYLFLIAFVGLTAKILVLKTNFKRLAYASIPWFFIPFLTVLSDETYLIFNQQGIDLLTPNLIYLLGLAIIVLNFSYRFWLVKSIPLNYISRAVKLYIPLLLITSISLFAFYTPFAESTTELFELGNPANGVMRLFKFNEWPIAEALSSHLLSEQIFGYIYVLLNGYTGTIDFFSYYYLAKVLAVFFITYYIIKTFNSRGMTYLFILLFPLIDHLFIAKLFPFFITLLLANKLLKNQSFKAILFYCLWNIFIVFWSPDLGISNGIPAFLFLIYLFLFSSDKKSLIRNISITSAIVAGLFGLIALSCWLQNIPLVSNLKQALNYFGANQAHGVVDLGDFNNRFYINSYILFPLTILGILFYSVFNYKKYVCGQEKLPFLSLVMLIVYYFVNFQRGLVRHGLNEGSDGFTNSFAFLILSLFVYLLLKNYSRLKVPVFVLLATLLIHSYKFPYASGDESLFEKFSDEFHQPSRLVKSSEKIDRVKNFSIIEPQTKEILNFLNENLNDTATFLDFTNTPMLYFYSQKAVPSYFNQSLQNVVTDYLQAENLLLLEKYDIPYVLFSHYPSIFWDKVDGVPNTIRHHMLAQHIFDKYQPYKVVGGYYVWKRKDIQISNSDTIDLEPLMTDIDYDLGFAPWVQIQIEHIIINDNQNLNLIKTKLNTWIITDSNAYSTNTHLLVELFNSGNSTSNIELILKDSLIRGVFSFKAIESDKAENYIIPLSTQYNWIHYRPDSLIIRPPKDIEIESLKLVEYN